MSTIHSNMFSMEEDYSKSIKNKDFKNTSTEIVNSIQKECIKDNFLKDAQAILKSSKGYAGANFIEITINYNNFQEYHYEIMNNRFLIVLYDNINSLFKYITSSGKVFITDDAKVIKIINTVPTPYKISLDYIPSINSNNIKSLRLLTAVLFDIDTEDPVQLLTYYTKPNVELYTENEYYINYYLFNIYPKLEYLITKYGYWNYFHFEQEIFNIANREPGYETINHDYLNLINETILSELKVSIKELNLDVNLDINNKNKLFDEIYNKTNYYLTINKSLMELLDYDKLSNLVINLNKYKLVNYIENNKSLPQIQTHNTFGIMSSSYNVDISFNISTKNLIRGSYKDLFFKIFISLIHNKQFKDIVNSDIPLINELLKETILDESELKIKSFLIENYIKATLLGYTSDDDILLYFETHLETIISEEDLIYIKDAYCNHLKSIKDLIDKYNETYTEAKQKILTSSKLDALGVVILDKIRLIQKNLIVEIADYCREFNDRNKSKMDIFYFDDEYIYLIVDNDSINVAFDTLTRVMPTVFSNYCPSMVSNCLIEIIE